MTRKDFYNMKWSVSNVTMERKRCRRSNSNLTFSKHLTKTQTKEELFHRYDHNIYAVTSNQLLSFCKKYILSRYIFILDTNAENPPGIL